MSVTLQVSVSMADGCVCTLPPNYTQYPITALLFCSLESLWNRTTCFHHRATFTSCISNTEDASVGHSGTRLLLFLLAGREALACREDYCLRPRYRPAHIHCLSEHFFLVRLFEQKALGRNFSVGRGKSGRWKDGQPRTLIPTGTRRIRGTSWAVSVKRDG